MFFMKKIIKKMKHWFYLQNITKRIFIIIMVVNILSNAIFVGSVFVIMKNQLFNKAKVTNEKEMQMIEKELDMFFKIIRNDAVTVLVSDSCQTLLSDSASFLSDDTALQYKKYKLIQGLIMSTIGQRSEYNTIVFYDLEGNCYADDRLIQSSENLKEKQDRVRELIASPQNEKVTAVNKSVWRKKKDETYKDCISYLRKVYNKEQGQLIGVLEMEIPNEAICELYRPLTENGSTIYVTLEDSVISAADGEMLYQDLNEQEWYGKLAEQEPEGGVKILETRENIFFQKVYTEFGWKLIDIVPTYTYMKDVKRYAAIDIMLGLMLLLGSLYISRILIISITKPLSKITNTITEIGQGDYNQRVHVKDGGEIGTLANEFNRMIDKTELLMEQIVEKEQEKRQADLSLIQMQMTPHFFYNILESICGLIVMDDKKTAIYTISLLSGFYRGVLNKGKEIISIEEELSIAVNYLEIMKVCHPGKFVYEINCSKAVRENSITKLTLQPILENAIHHGFENMSTGGRIQITGRMDGQRVILEISDNGKGIEPDYLENAETDNRFHMESFGLGNTDKRIKIYFGENYGITIVRQEAGTKIRIDFPATAER